jgi:hypothetical protein
VTGAMMDTIMRLDIAIQIVNILLNASDVDKNNAFESYIKSDLPKEQAIASLIDWIFINYSNLKGKNSPAGTRIYNLSINLE